MTTPDSGASVAPPPPGPLWPWLLAFAAVLAGAAGVVALLIAASDQADPTGGRPRAAAVDELPAVAVTVAVDELPAATAELYRYAHRHHGEFAVMTCYCGCDRTLGHRSLADCFVTATGEWDAHASGCGICTAEALTARRALDAGTPADTVAAELTARFGPDAAASPTRSTT